MADLIPAQFEVLDERFAGTEATVLSRGSSPVVGGWRDPPTTPLVDSCCSATSPTIGYFAMTR